MAKTSEYLRAYRAAQRELADLLKQQDKIGKRLIVVRQNIQGLAALCESERRDIDPSREAEYLLASSPLPDEILNILRADWPAWKRPVVIKQELEKLGHDMDKYQNALATVHMILKRLVEAGKAQEMIHTEAGYKMYRSPRSAVAAQYTSSWEETSLFFSTTPADEIRAAALRA